MAPRKGKKETEVNAEIIQQVLTDLQVAADQEDLSTLQRLLSFLDNHLKYEGAGNDALLKIREKAAKLHRYWISSLIVGDAVEVYWAREDTWYQARIISEDKEKNTLCVKYIGWGDQFNREINVISTPLNPPETFVLSKRKGGGELSWTFEEEETKDDIPVPPPSSDVETTKVELVTPIDAPIAEPVTENEDIFCIPIDTNSRRSSRRQSNDPAKSNGKTPTKQETEKKTKKKQEVEEYQDHNEWVCNVCSMIEAPLGTDLILCDGICRRSFHAECMPKKPKTNEDVWICDSCKTFNHQCFLCNEAGNDHIDVFKCSGKYCGKFYHRACLEIDNATFLRPKILEATIELENAGAKAYLERTGTKSAEGLALIDFTSYKLPIQTLNFECSMHFCDTCYEHYHKRSFGASDQDELTPCTFCPRAFHTNCIPPGSRYNSVCLVCPLHPYQPLPDKARDDSELLGGKGKKGKGEVAINAESINNIRLLYDQLTVPDLIPDRNDPFDNHFKLYHVIKEEIETTPKNFKMIVKNNYSLLPSDKVPPRVVPDTGCDCRVTCDERCYNRLSHIECCEMNTQRENGETSSKKVCTLGAHCGNRCFANREYAEGIVFREGSMGLGLKSANYVSKGTLVIEYIGEVMDEIEMIRRLETQRLLNPSDREYYVMELDKGVYVDGKYEGNVSRFINHSCNPNCILERWNVGGKIRIGIFARRDIKPGEPFSYDYQFDTQEDDVFQCFCGSMNCRGTMAPKKKERLLKLASRDKDLRKKLIEQGITKKEKLVEELRQDEAKSSYTGKYLPGDNHHEIKSGPSKGTFGYGQEKKLFLKRNILESSMLLLRKETLLKRIADHETTTRGGRKVSRRSYTATKIHPTTNNSSTTPTSRKNTSSSSSSSSAAAVRKNPVDIEDSRKEPVSKVSSVKKRKSEPSDIPTEENAVVESGEVSPVNSPVPNGSSSSNHKKRGKGSRASSGDVDGKSMDNKESDALDGSKDTMMDVLVKDESVSVDAIGIEALVGEGDNGRRSSRAFKPNRRYAD